MTRTSFVAGKSFVLALLFGAAASIPAAALPHFTGMHRHPGANAQDARVALSIYNASEHFRDVKIDGHVYTVLPHQGLAVKAPEGTAVYTETTGAMHRKGDMLFAVSQTMQHSTVSIK